MSNARDTVLVLDTQNKAALPIIESAWRKGRHVIAAAPHRCCVGMFSRFTGSRVLSPNSDGDARGYTNWLSNFVNSRRPTMVYATGDSATAIVAQCQAELRKHTQLVVPPDDVFAVGRDKILTLQAAERAGVAVPATWFPHQDGLDAVLPRVRFPSLIKPAISAGARGIVKVTTADAIRQSLPGVEAQFGRCFLQEYVPQTGMQYKVDVVIGTGGRLLAGVVYEKLRYYPPNGGSSVLNRTVRRPDILEGAVRLLSDIGWYGFADFDFIEDPRDGLVKLMEINPRFPESFRATYCAGYDMVEMLWDMAHGREPDPQLSYREDEYLRFLPGDLMWLLTSRNRSSQLLSWFRFFGRNLHYQVCALNDPGPIIGYLLENLFIALNSRRRAERFRLKQAREKPLAALAK
jgi:D-aspartate ligase